ncbi:MAG TPA: PaaI family thioesterase [Mycobacteriales bacterium]|jgi:acyl-coenzyme A thioesterase PaaI-like protein|nr:PaaI family thioesterase [Mycobacteriales bacterium]
MSDDAAVDLAQAVRQLMQASVLTAVDDETRRDLAAQVDALTKQLAAQSRETMPWPDPESMRRGDRPYSPVIGAANPIAPPMTVRTLDDGSVVGEATMRPIHEGPPAVVHGGWVATLLDQLLGHANAAAGVGGFTAELTVRYRRPTPYDVPLTVRARTDKVDGRRVHASGEIVADGVVTAEASGLFLMPSGQRLEEVAREYEARRASG